MVLTASNSSGTTVSKISSLVEQLSTKEVNFSGFVRKSSQACIHPDAFISFYQTVRHGEFHRIYKEILFSMVTPIFRIWSSQQKSRKQVHVISTAHHPYAIPRNNPRKHMNPVVNN